MTKKDYELIAGTLRYCAGHCDNEQESETVDWVASKFAETLPTTNARFDAARFMTACRIAVTA